MCYYVRLASVHPKSCSSYQGELVFEDLATFAENRALTTDPTDAGRGGAIYNGGTGSIAFNGPLTALWNIAAVRTTSSEMRLRSVGGSLCHIYYEFLLRLHAPWAPAKKG